VTEGTTLHTSDGVVLEGEMARAEPTPRAGAVLCHPHPQYGGTMRSIVIGALFEALPRAGVTCLRFNFRGVEGSTGTFDAGKGERVDAATAVAELSGALPSGVPLVLVGWSFGADIALSLRDAAIAAWFLVAPPLHYTDDPGATGRDPRPKLLALAEHDEVRAPADVISTTAEWEATTVEIVPGASHFFVGRTDRLVELALGFVDGLTRG